ncbi:MAG: metalloprotease TldD [Pseudomonadota bacterium]
MINDLLKQAEHTLLEPAELSASKLQKVLDTMMARDIDQADLYFQQSSSESWRLDDGIIKSGSYNSSRGVGARIISGEKTGFAYSDELILPQIEQSIQAAKRIARYGGSDNAQQLHYLFGHQLYAGDNPLKTVDDSDKIALMRQIEKAAYGLDPRVKRVTVALSAEHDVVLVAASDGTLAADIRPLVRLDVMVIVEENNRREQGYYGGGGRFDYSFFQQSDRASRYAQAAVREALIKLDAKPAPAGVMPVVLGPGWPAVLLHEAIGHGLEADFNRKGSSVFTNRIGERIASPLCTIVDDGSLPNRRGSLNIDDEGVPTQCTTLVEEGILKTYMQDKHNARLMKATPTGNGRRESYAHLPMPRMTNTYMLAGPHNPEEIIASVEKGLYAVNFSGGQVDITNGKFVFSASEAYLIEKGKVTQPVKGATLIGDGAEVLRKISMVGDDLKLDKGVGTCGKQGQSVPVGVGQPTLLVDELIVGGTETGE